MLQSSGNMKVPGALNILSCFLDVIFNLLLIFPAGERVLFGNSFWMPGLGLGVAGAALGTALSETVCAALMLYFLLRRSEALHLRRKEPGEKGTFGLAGVWIAMCTDLCTRGILFLIRLKIWRV